jgi:hypothetical protein
LKNVALIETNAKIDQILSLMEDLGARNYDEGIVKTNYYIDGDLRIFSGAELSFCFNLTSSNQKWTLERAQHDGGDRKVVLMVRKYASCVPVEVGCDYTCG